MSGPSRACLVASAWMAAGAFAFASPAAAGNAAEPQRGSTAYGYPSVAIGGTSGPSVPRYGAPRAMPVDYASMRTVRVAADGFDWLDAAIGGAAALGLVLALGTAVLARPRSSAVRTA